MPTCTTLQFTHTVSKCWELLVQDNFAGWMPLLSLNQHYQNTKGHKTWWKGCCMSDNCKVYKILYWTTCNVTILADLCQLIRALMFHILLLGQNSWMRAETRSVAELRVQLQLLILTITAKRALTQAHTFNTLNLNNNNWMSTHTGTYLRHS